MLSDLAINLVGFTDKCYQNYGFHQYYLISNVIGFELFQLLILLTFNLSFIVVNFKPYTYKVQHYWQMSCVIEE